MEKRNTVRVWKKSQESLSNTKIYHLCDLTYGISTWTAQVCRYCTPVRGVLHIDATHNLAWIYIFYTSHRGVQPCTRPFY